MKTLIRKELRENLWLIALGLVILGALLGGEYMAFREAMGRLSRGEIEQLYIVQPLKGDVDEYSLFFCAIFGAVFGWVQVFRERQRNVWAFLLHRPISPTRIFLSKVVSGLAGYTLVCGLPLLVFIWWASNPENVPAPFDWWLAAPIASAFVSGVLYYFAGLLTGSRRARWYVSGAFGFGLPFLVSCAVLSAPYLWLVVVLWLTALGVLATAAWSLFCNSGYDAGEHPSGKPTMAIALACGWIIVLFFAAIMITDIVERLSPDRPWSYQGVASDGTVYTVVHGGNAGPRITDRQGNVARNPRTGQPYTLAELQADNASSVGLHEVLGPRPERQRRWLDRSWLQLGYWGTSKGSLWYFMRLERRLVGYDVASRRLVGSIGPGGFAKDVSGGGDRFDILGEHTLGDKTALYTVDFAKPGLKTFFTTSPDDPIVAAADVETAGHRWEQTIVLTRRSIASVTPEGKTVWRANYSVPYPDGWIRIFVLDSPGALVVWNDPPMDPLESTATRQSSKLAWIKEGNVIETAELPPRQENRGVGIQEFILSGVMPPPMVGLAPAYAGLKWAPIWSNLVAVSLIVSLLCVPAGWIIARRRGATFRTSVAWCAAILIFGVSGLLTLMTLEEKPAREEEEPERHAVEIFEEPVSVH